MALSRSFSPSYYSVPGSSVWKDQEDIDLSAPALPHTESLEADGELLFRVFHESIDSSISRILPLNTVVKQAWTRHANHLPIMVPTADKQHRRVLIPRLDFVPYVPPDTGRRDVVTPSYDPNIEEADEYLRHKYPPYEWFVYNITAHEIIEAMLPLDEEHSGTHRLCGLAKQLITFGLRSTQHAKAAPLLGRAVAYTLQSWCSIRRIDEDEAWTEMSKLFEDAISEYTFSIFSDFWRTGGACRMAVNCCKTYFELMRRGQRLAQLLGSLFAYDLLDPMTICSAIDILISPANSSIYTLNALAGLVSGIVDTPRPFCFAQELVARRDQIVRTDEDGRYAMWCPGSARKFDANQHIGWVRHWLDRWLEVQQRQLQHERDHPIHTLRSSYGEYDPDVVDLSSPLPSPHRGLDPQAPAFTPRLNFAAAVAATSPVILYNTDNNSPSSIATQTESSIHMVRRSARYEDAVSPLSLSSPPRGATPTRRPPWLTDSDDEASGSSDYPDSPHIGSAYSDDDDFIGSYTPSLAGQMSEEDEVRQSPAPSAVVSEDSVEEVFHLPASPTPAQGSLARARERLAEERRRFGLAVFEAQVGHGSGDSGYADSADVSTEGDFVGGPVGMNEQERDAPAF